MPMNRNCSSTRPFQPLEVRSSRKRTYWSRGVHYDIFEHGSRVRRGAMNVPSQWPELPPPISNSSRPIESPECVALWESVFQYAQAFAKRTKYQAYPADD